MLQRITSLLFNTTVVLAGVVLAIWLTITGHTLLVGGLLVAMAAVLAAVMFGFRVAEGSGPDRLSIWVGPLPLRRAASVEAAREAA
jgi:hypothetical protein